MAANTDMLEALPVPVYTTDAEGRLTFYNSAAAEFWGHRPELGVTTWCGSWRLFWPDGRPLPHDECPMAIALKEGRPVRGTEAVAERPDGTRVPFLPFPTPLRDEAGRVIGGINLLVDVADRTIAEIESARLAAIVSSCDDAIISKRLDGTITSWNAAATRMFGYESDEIVGQSITKLIPPELQHEEREIIAKLTSNERIHHYETVRVAKDGHRLDISLTVSPLHDRTGRVVGASKVARDITERKQAEALQTLLLNELNHRVKNTLAMVQAIATQSLRHTASTSDFVTAFTGRLHALAKAHTLFTTAQVQGADLMEVVREQVLLGVFDERITCSGPQLTLDAQLAVHVAMVLHELATNARKYGALSVPRGRLSVTWDVRTNGGRNLHLEWRESGGPAVRLPQAPGFGTTLVSQTLQAHGGSASIRYAEAGVTCDIVLPVPHQAAPSIAEHFESRRGEIGPVLRQERMPSRLQGKRILIIEDEPLVAMDVEASLKRVGCEIAGSAGTIGSAKELISKTTCDAALLDANLGGRAVDEVAAALARRNIPFAFVTGYARDALPSGFRDTLVLGKPFSNEQLLAIVEVLLYQRLRKPEVVPLRPRQV
jgi:PAS domain S-box-containing protein